MDSCKEEEKDLKVCVQYNGETVEVPTPFNWDTMNDRAYHFETIDIYVQGLDGSTEVANEFLDFSVEKTPSVGL